MKKLLLASIFLWYLILPIDTDLGWHLRYGQQIFQNHQIFKTNQLGFFLSNYHWQHAYSLYQLLTFTFFKFFGFWSLTFGNALLLTAVFWLITKTFPKKNILFLTLSFIYLLLISQPITNLGWRSQLFSLLGISSLYFSLLKKEKLFFFPLIFLLWANLHGGFVLGLALLFFFLIEKIYLKEKITPFLLLALASAFATLINPFGLNLYQEIYRHTWYPLNQLIAEWVSPKKTSILLIILSVSTILLGLFSQKKIKNFFKKKNSLFLFLSWLFFLILALKARRNLAVFGLASVYLTNHLFQFKAKKIRISKIIIFLIFSTSLTWRLTKLPLTKISWTTICENSKWSLPCQATQYLKNNPHLCQNIFNTYEWGGYLTWHLPTHKTFVDGRMPTWPTTSRQSALPTSNQSALPTSNNKSPYTIYLEILQSQPGFEQKLEAYKADCLLIGKGTFLDLELKNNPSPVWERIYEDEIAALYTLKKQL